MKSVTIITGGRGSGKTRMLYGFLSYRKSIELGKLSNIKEFVFDLDLEVIGVDNITYYDIDLLRGVINLDLDYDLVLSTDISVNELKANGFVFPKNTYIIETKLIEKIR